MIAYTSSGATGNPLADEMRKIVDIMREYALDELCAKYHCHVRNVAIEVETDADDLRLRFDHSYGHHVW